MEQQAGPAVTGFDSTFAALRPGLELLALPACVIDHDLRYHYVNPAYVRHFGKPAEAFIGFTADQVFSQRPSDDRRHRMQQALAGETVIFNRRTLEGPNAGRWVRAHYLPLRQQGDGNVVGVVVVLVDVQPLKDAEARLEVAVAQEHDLRERLQVEESRMRDFLENIPGSVAVIDGDLRFVYANKLFRESRGMGEADVAGHPVVEVLGIEDFTRFIVPNLERLKAGETCSYERQVRNGSGHLRWRLVRLVPTKDSSGAFSGYYSLGTDIHELKVAQEQLRSQEAQLRLFTDNIPDAVAYLDTERRVLFANRQFAEQRGGTPESILGHTTAELMGEETAAWIAQRTQKVFDRGEIATYERESTLPDGTKRWGHVKAVPDFGEMGTVRGMYIVAHDITELKRAQEALEASEEELRFFAENIPEAIVYVDLNRGCRFVNNLFLQTRGLTRDAVLGKYPQDVYPPALMKMLDPHLARVAQGEETSFERKLRLPSGTERWVRVSMTPRRDSAGRVVGYYVISTDIHELKAAQAVIEDKERQLRQVIDSIPTPMCYVDAQNVYRYVNDAFLAYIGRDASDIVGHPVKSVLGEERWGLLAPVMARVRAGESLAVERYIRFADGRSRWMVVRLSPRIVEGDYQGYYATTSDIHEQKMVEDELRRANTILSAHFDNTPLAVIEFDTELRIVRWSGQAEAIFGWAADETLGRGLTTWRNVYEEDEAQFNQFVRALVEGRERHATFTLRNYRKDGTVIWVEWHNSALRDEHGQVISILSLAQDVSSRIQAEERLQYMATHDGLTGLPNSVLLNDRLNAALIRAKRAKKRVGVMFLDLDHFKDVNDSLGHRIGDGLLKELARRIRGGLRQSDLLARVSGDEFVVLLEDVPLDGAPDLVASKMLEEVRRPFNVEGHEIHVSGSLGIAIYPDDGADSETLLKNADAAMYHAKELGRNGFRMFSEELARRRQMKVQVETALRRALRGDELTLHYQPIMDMATREIRRAEALLRWNDPERGLILPMAFIPLAEETGLGHALGHWVLETACRQARAWRDQGLGTITVCVNLSASQLRDTSLVNDLKSLLESNGCEPGWLQLEITETSMVRDVESAGTVLARLRALGVRIAIDDFGTGFSSLSHLRHLPVDVLKIDKGFVADIETGDRAGRENAGGAAIASAVIGLARGLGLDVVAEGVENQKQLAFLADRGCDAAQGYLICPPLPAAEFERWLKARQKPPKKPATTKPKPKTKRKVAG